MPIIVIIDDDALGGSITKNQIEDIFVGIGVRLLTDKDDILGFQPTDENLLIVDQHLFDSFNHRSEKVDGFPTGTELAKKYAQGGFKGKIIVYTGDEDKAEKENTKGDGFFKSFFRNKKTETIEYAVKGSKSGFKQIIDKIEAIQ